MSHIILVSLENDQSIVIAQHEKWYITEEEEKRVLSVFVCALSELRRNVEFEEKHLSMSNTISLMVIDHCLQDFITFPIFSSFLTFLLNSDIGPPAEKNSAFGGVKPPPKQPKKNYGFLIHTKNTFCKKNGQKRIFQPSAVA